MLAIGTIGPALAEELLFRGFLLGALAKSRLGFGGGAMLSSLAWALLHARLSAIGIANVFVVALVLSWLLWRTGSVRVDDCLPRLLRLFILLFLRFVGLSA